MKVCCITPTHQGSQVLALTLPAMAAQSVDGVELEWIYVDNASTDATPLVLAAHAERHGVTVITEPRRGKSIALNRALDATDADLVVFIDDDVIPEPGWLAAFVDAYRAHPDVRVFAGQVRHHWLAPPPPWLEALALQGRSLGGTPIDQPEGWVRFTRVKGGNFAIPGHLARTLRFDVESANFGQRGATGGEDTRFVFTAVDGTQAWFVPDAVGRHIVRPHELDLSSVLQRYYRIGRGAAALEFELGTRWRRRTFARQAGYIADTTLRAAIQAARGDKVLAVRSLIRASIASSKLVYQAEHRYDDA